ncbi:conjugal transfer protein TraF [Vibrio astriarenae]|uniref:Conjugal transfer protein TraF n=1 Tax=Vibrio astriarenae TaxID=1481923 RepID=A0A7Z2T532_9VIBR|nr:conjugal transfer protein TraF [Vibrio astriarenae]QIA64573.1 conjugal transfer protein TraF [Vibrio astriarenae]
MKRLTTLAMSVALGLPLVANATVDSRSFAMGGTGVASATYLTSSIHNPALASQYGDSDNFGMIFPTFSARVHDSSDMVDTIDRFDDAFMRWEDDIWGGNPDADPSEWQNILRELQGEVLTAEASTGIIIAIPNKYLSTNFFALLNANVIGVPLVDERDFNPDINDPDDLHSSVYALGGATLDVGLTFAKQFDWFDKPLHLGISPKMQQMLSLGYGESVNDFEDDDFDFDDANTEAAFNMDIGAAYELTDKWNLAFSARNLISRELETNEYLGQTSTYVIKPEYVVGASYDRGWYTLTTDVDLTSKEYFKEIDYKTQYARFGAELDAWRWAQIRVGYAHSMTDHADDVVTAGLGLKPFGLFGLDLSGSYGTDNNYGISAQMILHF